jgi:hypothetical protein
MMSEWRNMGSGPGGKGTLWMKDVAGGWLYIFFPHIGSPTITFAPSNS